MPEKGGSKYFSFKINKIINCCLILYLIFTPFKRYTYQVTAGTASGKIDSVGELIVDRVGGDGEGGGFCQRRGERCPMLSSLTGNM